MSYLSPDLKNLRDPFLMKGMREMVAELLELRGSGDNRIGIHGDYDADGLTSTALLTRGLKALGFEPVPFVPHRVRDGYGVSMEAIRNFERQGIKTVLTCDTGSSAVEEVRQANELGVRVLITDHHTVPDVLPDSDVIVNPQQKDCPYPFKGLCGVGVAYKLLQGLCRKLDVSEEAVLHPMLDLVAIGTICDVMPLIDENRALVRQGLIQARDSRNQGLVALLDRIGIQRDKLNERTVGYAIGPRLNSAGRIDETSKALDLLLCEDPIKARDMANEIESINDRRKDLTRVVEKEAILQAQAQLAQFPDRKVLSIFSPTTNNEAWHPGLMGVVSARVVNATGKSVFAFAIDSREGIWKGSGRRAAGSDIHLHGALKDVAERTSLVSRYGGHTEAAGASLSSGREEAKAFAEAIDDAARRQQPELAFGGVTTETGKNVTVEAEVNIADLSGDFVKLMGFLGPFGQGNPQVAFWARDLEVAESRVFGNRAGEKEEHIELVVKQGEHQIKAMGWGMAEQLGWLHRQDKPASANIAFGVSENVFRNMRTVRMDLLDATPGQKITHEAKKKSAGSQSGSLPAKKEKPTPAGKRKGR